MQDDTGIPFQATLSEVMYVPGLSRRLFSVTQFAQHGHCAIVQQQGTTLLFGPRKLPVTIPYHTLGRQLASNLSVITPDSANTDSTYHSIPTYRNKDQNKKRLPLELLHSRLGHRKCRTLLAASEHNLWEDTTIRMTRKTGCLTCGIATIRSRARNKEPHSGATWAGEYLFLEIQHPLVQPGLTRSTSYAFYLLIVDAYSRYVKIYGIPKKSMMAMISALQLYQAEHSPRGNYGYLDTTRIRADVGSQFTSHAFADYCIEQGINLVLAAPCKQYQNHLAERTWQTVTSTARSLLVHARLPDTFWYHALAYSTYIFNVLPVQGLRGEDPDVPATPHELFFGTKPRVGHLHTFGCPVIIRKWTCSDNTHGKQTERGIRGIFIGEVSLSAVALVTQSPDYNQPKLRTSKITT
jgi:transposase InsO family protein